MFYRIKDDRLYDYADYKYNEECLETDIITQKELQEHPQKVIISEKEIEIEVPDFEVRDIEVEIHDVDENGEYIYDEDGNPVTHTETRPVQEQVGSHTEKKTIKILVLNPEWEEIELAEAKKNKYDEANSKALSYINSGEALFTFEKDDNIYHIEATDGNIAKIGLKATALLIAGDTETTFPWNTKEDINIQINALEGKFIAEGLGEVQDEVWTIKFPNYVNAINEAETVDEVNAIEINYNLN